MVGRQIGSCALPGGCDVPLTPIPPFCNLTQCKRKMAGTQSTDATNMAHLADTSINGYPYCNEPRTQKSNLYSVDPFGFGDDTVGVQTSGTSFEEVTWTISSNVVLTSNQGIYKRNGIQVLATNIPMRYRRYTMTSTCTYSRTQVDATSPVAEILETTQNANCQCNDCSPSPATIDIYVQRYPSVTTTGSCGGAGNLTFNYIPVASGDISGLRITPILGTWSIVVAGNLTISNTTGDLYTFNGTLTSVAAAINATAGGTLFSASVGGLVDGSVALVSDLKPFTSKTNQPVSGCIVDLPLIYAGDELAPSSISEGPFREVYNITGPFIGVQPLKFDQFAIDEGFADTSAGYLNWLSAVRTPKWPIQYVVDPSNAWATSSYNVFLALSVYIIPVNSSPIGVFKSNWSLTGGESSKPYDTVFVCPYTGQTTSFQVIGTYCPQYPEDCEANNGYPGEGCCNELDAYCPSPWFGTRLAYCILADVTFNCVPDFTQSGTLSVSGYWKFE